MNAEKLISNVLGSLIGVAAMGAAAQVSISLPESISVAPITGQSLAVLLIAWILKWKWASISMILYFIVGCFAPVFSDFESGIDVLTGPTMGYFIGFLIAAIVVGKLAENQKSRFLHYLLQMTIGTLIILIIGMLGLLRYLTIQDAFLKGVLPFLIGGLVKIVLGAILLSTYRRFRTLLNQTKS